MVGERFGIVAARVVTGRSDEVLRDAVVWIEQGKIVDVSTTGAPQAGRGAPTVVRYDGGTILPGLVDAHVHLTMRRGETSLEHMTRVSDEQALLRGVEAAGRILGAGVTTVRDCAGRGRLVQALRDGVRDGLIAGPRILASGPPVTTTAGHLWPLGYEADTADEARRAVRRLVKEDVDFIKVCATGGGMTPGSVVGRAQYATAELQAVVEDAHRLQRPVAAHAHGTAGIAAAVAAGVDTVEHVSWLDASGTSQAFDEAVARRMASQGTVACIASSPPPSLLAAGPTAGAGQGQQAAPEAATALTGGRRPTLARWEHARRMLELGVPVCFATDAVYGWWADFHDLSYLAQALVEVGGFPPYDVLRMITAVPAQAIGWGDRLGTIETGKLADLLVVDGDPLQDVRALRAVRAVYQAGVLASGGGAPRGGSPSP
jgi:imidazolonepropionase-like amidohydrolase